VHVCKKKKKRISDPFVQERKLALFTNKLVVSLTLYNKVNWLT